MSQVFFKAEGFVSGRSLPFLINVEPLIPYTEKNAYGHWLFGGGEFSLIDVINQRPLTLQSGATTQPVYGASSVTIPTTAGNALLSDINDTSSQSLTLCAVVKCALTSLSILLGNLTPVSGPNLGSGFGVFASSGKASLTLRAHGGVGGGINTLATDGNFVQTNNFFVAVSIDKLTKKGIVYAQQSGAEFTNEASYTDESYVSSLNKIGIGNVIYTGSVSGGANATYSEAIIFNKALSLDEIKAVALRSKERLLSRNVTF